MNSKPIDAREVTTPQTCSEAQSTDNAELHLTLARERSLLRTMIDLIPANIYAKDAQSRFLASNVRVARSMGATPEQLLGKTDFDFFPPAMAQTFFDDEQAIVKSGQALIDREEQVLDHTTIGSMRTYSTSKIPFHDNLGNVIGTVGIGHDITERRDNERKQRELQQQLLDEMQQRERSAIELRLAQKLESVGRLASGVAHEINTPIQFVNDSLYFLRSAFDDLNNLFAAYRNAAKDLPVSESTERFLQTIAAAATVADFDFLQAEIPKAFARTFDGASRVTNIVRAMKEFAHPDSMEHNPADINHALQTTLIIASNEYKYLAAVSTEFGELPLVDCNIGELNQVFLNLIVNAAHAIQDSGKDALAGNILIRTVVAGDNVEITIADNGCGIPQQHLDKIFDPFFTTKEVGRGTGQGLAIARSIVIEKHHGDIRVHSTPDSGTQFTLCLPIDGHMQSNSIEQ